MLMPVAHLTKHTDIIYYPKSLLQPDKFSVIIESLAWGNTQLTGLLAFIEKEALCVHLKATGGRKEASSLHAVAYEVQSAMDWHAGQQI